MSQHELWNVLEEFNSSKNLDQLWSKMIQQLSGFGVKSVMYGVTHSVRQLISHGAENALTYRTNHPSEYREYFDDQFDFNDDITAVHCLTRESSFVWHDYKAHKYQPTPSQIRFMNESAEFGMRSGVTLPLRFGKGGAGGMGVCNGEMTEKEFDSMWLEHGDNIVSICRLFDEVARGNCTKDLFSLTKREIEVLHWLGDGKCIKGVAYKLGTSPNTVDKQVREARRKLKSRNNEQAVLKAYALGLILP